MRFFQNRLRFLLTEETQATSSTCHTLAETPGFGTRSTRMGLRQLWKSSMLCTMQRSKTYLSISQSHLSKLRVPSKMARLVYKRFVPRSFLRAPAIMDYSTLGSISSGLTQAHGRTSWLSTTTSTWLPLCRTMKFSWSSSRRARRITTTSAKMRPSMVSATQDFVVPANSASVQQRRTRLKSHLFRNTLVSLRSGFSMSMDAALSLIPKVFITKLRSKNRVSND